MLVDLCSGRLFADQYGGGVPRVVALHGWGRSRADWPAVLTGLDALAVHLPGFGRSPRPSEPWTTRDYADQLVDCLGEKSVILVGHSFGGRVAVQLAAAYPKHVKSLVLTGVPLLHQSTRQLKSPLAYRLIRRAHGARVVPHRVMEAARQKYGSADYKAADGVMRSVLVAAVNEEYIEQMQAIRRAAIPTFLVWGQKDSAAPVAIASRAKEIIGDDAHLETIPESGHLLDQALSVAIRERILETLESSNSREDK